MDRGAWRGHKELDMTEQLTLSLSLRSKHQSRNPDKGICILPLYLWRIGSGTFPPANTKIHRCSSPLCKMVQYFHITYTQSRPPPASSHIL